MKTPRLRFFSLIEVLIALSLVALALPLLTLPYFYGIKNMAEIRQSLDHERLAQQIITRLYVELHQGMIPLARLKEKTPFDVPEEWMEGVRAFPATYLFKELESEDPDKPELKQVELTLGNPPLKFNYQLVVIPSK